MSYEERANMANQILSELRRLSYDEVRGLMRQVRHKIVEQEDGKRFQIQIEAFWDDSKRKNVRVLVAVSDSGVSDFLPTSVAFIISPDGSFVGEAPTVKPPKS